MAYVKKGGLFCAGYGCSNNKKEHRQLSFFRFPKDESRCRRWVVNCRRQDLGGKATAYLYQNCRLCSSHFEDDQFMNSATKDRLVWDAVPTIFPNVPNPPKMNKRKRQCPKERLPPPGTVEPGSDCEGEWVKKHHVCLDHKEGCSQLNAMKPHMVKHRGEKCHVWSECGNGFSHLSKLKRHMATPTGDKPHVCSECGKGFSQLDNLKTHMVTHTGDKPHVCSDCGKGFTQLCNLKRHMLTHPGEKPHMCSDCGKEFSQLHILKAHMLTHAEERVHVHYKYMQKEGWTLTLAKSYSEQLQGNSECWSRYSSCETCVEGFGLLPELENHLVDHP